jgi:hypothetical protein
MGVLVAICNKCFEVGFVVSRGIYIGCNRLLRLNFDVLRYFDFRNEHKKQMLRTIWLQYETNSIVAFVIVATTHIVAIDYIATKHCVARTRQYCNAIASWE